MRVWLMLLWWFNVRGCCGKNSAPKGNQLNILHDWTDSDVYEDFFGIKLDSAPVPPKVSYGSSVQPVGPSIQPRAPSFTNFVQRDNNPKTLMPGNSFASASTHVSPAEHYDQLLPFGHEAQIQGKDNIDSSPSHVEIIRPSDTSPVLTPSTRISPSDFTSPSQYTPNNHASNRSPEPNVNYNPFMCPVQPHQTSGSNDPNNTPRSPMLFESSVPYHSPPDVLSPQTQIQGGYDIDPSPYTFLGDLQSIGPDSHNSHHGPLYSPQRNYVRKVSTGPIVPFSPSQSMAARTPTPAKTVAKKRRRHGPKALFDKATEKNMRTTMKEMSLMWRTKLLEKVKADAEADANNEEKKKLVGRATEAYNNAPGVPARNRAKMKDIYGTAQRAFENMKRDGKNMKQLLRCLPAEHYSEFVEKIEAEIEPEGTKIMLLKLTKKFAKNSRDAKEALIDNANKDNMQRTMRLMSLPWRAKLLAKVKADAEADAKNEEKQSLVRLAREASDNAGAMRRDYSARNRAKMKELYGTAQRAFENMDREGKNMEQLIRCLPAEHYSEFIKKIEAGIQLEETKIMLLALAKQEQEMIENRNK